MSPATAWHYLVGASARPTQIESVVGSQVWLWGTLHGAIPAITHSYGSSNMAGALSTDWATASLWLTLLGVDILYLQYYRQKTTLSSTYLGVIGMVILTSKVFSTQYLIWLLRLVGDIVGDDLVWIVICVLSTGDALIYPFPSPISPATFHLESIFLLVFVRNGLLLFAIMRDGCFQGRGAFSASASERLSPTT